MTAEKQELPPFSYVEVTEQKRLNAAREQGIPWKKWGPYLSERQWGTVREDYSKDGNAWDYFSHDQSRSRAYRWGEDGLAGISDDKQRLCFALALWNGRDPILKERLFGLTNSEGNHGEDVKEYYFYLDSTPTHSYMKYLYKYPAGGISLSRPGGDQRAALARRDGVRTSRHRHLRRRPIFRCLRGICQGRSGRCADQDLGLQSRPGSSPDSSASHIVVPQHVVLGRRRTEACCWARSTENKIHASHPQLGEYTLQCEGAAELLFTENETNASRLWGQPNPTPYVKDAFHEYVISGEKDAVNPCEDGNQSCRALRAGRAGWRKQGCAPAAEREASCRCVPTFDQIFASRLADADEFYERITPKT